MVIPIRKQMDELDRKIADMEKSISLIARHVKKEMEAAKKPQPKADLKEIAELKKQGEKISAMEGSIKSIARQLKEDLEAAKKEIKQSQLRQLLEIKKITEEDRAPQDTEKMQQIEARLDEEINRLETFVADSNKVVTQDIETKLGQEIARLEDIVHDSGRLLTEKGMEDYLSKLSKLKSNLERYVNVKTQLLETRINEVTEAVRNLEAGRDFIKLDERLAAAEAKTVSEIGSIKKSLQNLAPESEFVGLENSLKALKKKLDVFETAEDFQNFRQQTEKRLRNEDAALAETRSSLEEDMKKLMLDFTYRLNKMKRAVEDETEKFRDLVSEQELQALRNEVGEIRQAVDNENANRLSLEKNFTEMEQAIRNTNAAGEIEAIRQAVEEETAKRMSLEKSVADMENMLGGLKERYSAMGRLEKLDFDSVEQEIKSFRDAMKNAERDTHISVMNAVTEQMNEFAKAMDRKIPEIMTRSEFEQSLAAIREKLRSVESPDLTPLAMRVGQLERELANISRMINSIYNRVPIVVE